MTTKLNQKKPKRFDSKLELDVYRDMKVIHHIFKSKNDKKYDLLLQEFKENLRDCNLYLTPIVQMQFKSEDYFTHSVVKFFRFLNQNGVFYERVKTKDNCTLTIDLSKSFQNISN